MIDELRDRIDVIDEQLVALLNTRAACAIEIGRLKREHQLPMYQPDREAAVIRHARAITAVLGGPLTEDAISRLFERIIDEARQLEVAGDAAREGRSANPTPVADAGR
jgi:chorismate mutase-like protein